MIRNFQFSFFNFQKAKLRVGFIFLCLSIIIIGFSFTVNAKGLPYLKGLISPREFTVLVSTPQPLPTPAWTISGKINEARELLKNLKPSVGIKDVSYSEPRYAFINDKMVSTTKMIKEPERQIALAALDTSTGKIQTLMIVKRGGEIIPPTGWRIDILQRPNGISWNAWNTAYRINSPANKLVIGNMYPDEHDTTVVQKTKKKTVYITKRTVDYRFYVPYSPDLHGAELIQAGQKYTADVVVQAFKELKDSNVRSQALQDYVVADVFASKSYFFTRLPLLEQTDFTEFQIDPQNTVERAKVIVGANLGQAFGVTCNSSSACGWVQFTPGTYKTIVNNYPEAKLTKDFKTGAADHLNSMKAAILLYDENLKGLVTANGDKVLNDPKLEEYLASSYNGAPRHVYASLKEFLLSGLQDWIEALGSKNGGLKNETKGYLIKLRWLQQYGKT